MPKNTTEKCCSDCFTQIPDRKELTFCHNRSCKCHTTTENGWKESKERFKERFQKTGWWPHLESMGKRSLDEFIGAILAFIESVWVEAYEKGLSDAKDV